MDIHAISKGIVLYFLFVILLLYFIILNDFMISFNFFSVVLILSIFYIGYKTGKSSKKANVFHSFLVGFFSSVFLLTLLANYTYSHMLNIALVFIWCTI